MLRIIMDACNIRSFGVCNASVFENTELDGSVIAVLFPNRLENGEYADEQKARAAAENILKVACSALERAFGPYDFTPYLDNSPIPGELAAAASGLGVIGRPGWFISRQYGTDCFIGVITSRLQFPATGKEINRCEDCGLCDDACPTPGSCVNPGRSRNLPRQPECTLCRKACPHNSSAHATYIKAFE